MTTPLTKRKISALDVDTTTASLASANAETTLVSPENCDNSFGSLKNRTVEASRSSTASSLAQNLQQETRSLRRRSSRSKSKRQFLNMDGKDASYKDKPYDQQSALMQMDASEKLGRDIWNESKAQIIPFLSVRCAISGNDNWCFYPSKHCRKDLFGFGTQGVHYAYGYSELGNMVTKYGRDVTEWPRLVRNEANKNGDQENVPIPTAPLVLRKSSTTKKKKTTAIVTNSDIIQRKSSSVLTRLQSLEELFVGTSRDIAQDGILKRLGHLEKEVFGDDYDKKLKGIQSRLHRLEELAN